MPSLRMASAPIRPLTAWKVLVVRPFCTIGFGPWACHVPPRALPLTLSLAMAPACAEALVRSAAACCSVSGSSPASSRLQ